MNSIVQIDEKDWEEIAASVYIAVLPFSADELEKKSKNENRIVQLHDDISSFEDDLAHLYRPSDGLYMCVHSLIIYR